MNADVGGYLTQRRRVEDVQEGDEVLIDGDWERIVDVEFLSGNMVCLFLADATRRAKQRMRCGTWVRVRRSLAQSDILRPMTEYKEITKRARELNVGDLVVVRDVTKPVFALTITDDEDENNNDLVFVCFEDETYVKVPRRCTVTVRVPEDIVMTLSLTESKRALLSFVISAATERPTSNIRRKLLAELSEELKLPS